MANITGHGLRKLMRAERDLTYVINELPDPQEEFSLIQEVSGNDDEEMHGTFNMGGGYGFYIPKKDVETASLIARQNGYNPLDAGYVTQGPRQVIIKPKNLVYKAKTLGVR